MFRSLRICSFSLVLAASVVALPGCGGAGSGPAEFNPDAVVPVTAEQEQAALDYEAQLEKEQKEQYGN